MVLLNVKIVPHEVGVAWIVLAQDKDRWKALVNAVLHFWIP